MTLKSGVYLRLDKYLVILYIFITYISWQLHELGHWFMCRIMGVEAIFGFNEWKIVSTKGAIVFAVVAGPLTTLLLATIGFTLILHKLILVKRIGLLFAVSNSLINIGSALTSIRYAIRHPDLTTEPIWKLLLCPIFILILILSLKLYNEGLLFRSLMVMILITACIGLAAIPIDEILWSYIDQGNPICMPLAGISKPVIVTNTIVIITTVLFILKYRHKLANIKA